MADDRTPQEDETTEMVMTALASPRRLRRRMDRHADLLTPEQVERFWASVNRRGPEECWPWTGMIHRFGYGRTSKNWGAHRVAWELGNARRIPDGLVIDHLCRNRACVNPSHLEVVTGTENTRRGNGITEQQKRRTHCIYGHELSGDNVWLDVRGGRRCRACNRERNRASDGAKAVIEKLQAELAESRAQCAVLTEDVRTQALWRESYTRGDQQRMTELEAQCAALHQESESWKVMADQMRKRWEAAQAQVAAAARQRSEKPANAPTCPSCEGKGWGSPEDVERGIRASGELFTAGYEHGKRMEAESRASLVALVEQRVREDAPTANSEYCWHCQADVNGKNGPAQDHADECWWKRAAIALAALLAGHAGP